MNFFGIKYLKNKKQSIIQIKKSYGILRSDQLVSKTKMLNQFLYGSFIWIGASSGTLILISLLQALFHSNFLVENYVYFDLCFWVLVFLLYSIKFYVNLSTIKLINFKFFKVIKLFITKRKF